MRLATNPAISELNPFCKLTLVFPVGLIAHRHFCNFFHLCRVFTSGRHERLLYISDRRAFAQRGHPLVATILCSQKRVQRGNSLVSSKRHWLSYPLDVLRKAYARSDLVYFTALCAVPKLWHGTTVPHTHMSMKL